MILLTLCALPIYSVSQLADAGIHQEQRDGVPFSQEALDALRKENKPVFLDATAAWCITCKFNERVALTDDVRQHFKDKGITFMVADWTSRDEAITRYLAAFNRRGVPLYVYYPANGDPVILPQILTKQIVLETVK